MTDAAAVQWLLAHPEPAVRYLTRTRLLSESCPQLEALRTQIPQGPWVCALLQQPPGGHAYQKWVGSHWRLVSLSELALLPGHPQAEAASEQVLRWLTSARHRDAIPTINGRVRRCASQEGNALLACSRLGLSGDPRVRQLAASLAEWQWPDGGWNCDRNPDAAHSSFHESITPLLGLWAYYEATGDPDAKAAAHRTAELLLRHRLFRSERTSEVIAKNWLELRWPAYWHYNFFDGLRALAPMGLLADARAAEALALLAAKRRTDGLWAVEGRWWRRAGSQGSGAEAVDWGGSGPNPMITLHALLILQAAQRATGGARQKKTELPLESSCSLP